jgi:hypothetical protein
MKNISTIIRSFFSMGFLGWILPFMAVALFFGAYPVISHFQAFDKVWQRVDALTVLENQVSNHLQEMELDELRYIYAMEYETPVADELETAADHAAQINQLIDDLVAAGHFTAKKEYSAESIEMLSEFQNDLGGHQKTFEQVALAYQSDDTETAQEYLTESESENADLQILLKDIIANVDADRTDAVRQFPSAMTAAIQSASIALIIMMLLALAGYRGIALLTQPLTNLTNAVVAAGGDRYRTDLTAAERKLHNSAGIMARALDIFAKAIEQRDAAQKQAIADLRERLYESRRSRLKISGPGR